MFDLHKVLELVAKAHIGAFDSWQDDRAIVQRVRGGMNNALYRVRLDGEDIACKLCVPDERQRARREYEVLKLLHAEGLNLAPTPLGLDESCSQLPYPAVVYKWLTGEPITHVPTKEQWAVLCANSQRLHGIGRENFIEAGISVAVFHWLDRAPYLEELGDLWARYGPWLRDSHQEGLKLWGRLERLVEQCNGVFGASTLSLGTDAVNLCLCRVDSGSSNIIVGRDNCLRWVDWEFCGWGDPALDLADLRWHVAYLDVEPEYFDYLRAQYQPPSGDATFFERMLLWGALLSVRWPFLVLRLLWSQANGPDRLRLTMPTTDEQTLWARLSRTIERAEVWYGTS